MEAETEGALDRVRRELAERIGKLGLTLIQVAELADCHPRTVSRALKGQTTSSVLDSIDRAVTSEEARRSV